MKASRPRVDKAGVMSLGKGLAQWGRDSRPREALESGRGYPAERPDGDFQFQPKSIWQ